MMVGMLQALLSSAKACSSRAMEVGIEAGSLASSVDAADFSSGVGRGIVRMHSRSDLETSRLVFDLV